MSPMAKEQEIFKKERVFRLSVSVTGLPGEHV
jgi:hypothetical protein